MTEPRVTYSVSLPPDLGLAIMIVLSFHVGRYNTISRANLCAELNHLQISDRQLREQIKQLRRSGHLIGSLSGENGGYYLITTPDDLHEFLRREYQAKIDDMRQTVEAMTRAASQRWGPASIQLRML
ncbi:MAG: Rrf2 family transcriptional regulator [Anaerolineales bacterium]|nr:Rrf2 family transcriptional regulator [Anaerolineales bacterium]